MNSLDESWEEHSLEKACRAYPSSNYYDGATEFQRIALKRLNAMLDSTHDPNVATGIQFAISTIEDLEAENEQA